MCFQFLHFKTFKLFNMNKKKTKVICVIDHLIKCICTRICLFLCSLKKNTNQKDTSFLNFRLINVLYTYVHTCIYIFDVFYLFYFLFFQSYDNILVSSIYHLSHKLKNSTDRTLTKLRQDMVDQVTEQVIIKIPVVEILSTLYLSRCGEINKMMINTLVI